MRVTVWSVAKCHIFKKGIKKTTQGPLGEWARVRWKNIPKRTDVILFKNNNFQFSSIRKHSKSLKLWNYKICWRLQILSLTFMNVLIISPAEMIALHFSILLLFLAKFRSFPQFFIFQRHLMPNPLHFNVAFSSLCFPHGNVPRALKPQGPMPWCPWWRRS